MRWSVVSLNDGRPHGEVAGTDARRQADSEGAGDAKSALDRIVIPQDTLDRIAAMASPRSSLIISDEALSSETGKGTDFVVLLSGEPQGGIATRRARPAGQVWYGYERPRYRLPFWR